MPLCACVMSVTKLFKYLHSCEIDVAHECDERNVMSNVQCNRLTQLFTREIK